MVLGELEKRTYASIVALFSPPGVVPTGGDVEGVPPSGGNAPPSGGDAPPSGGDAPPFGGDVEGAPPSGGDAPPFGGDVDGAPGAPPSGGDVPPSGGETEVAEGDPGLDGGLPPSGDDAGGAPPSEGFADFVSDGFGVASSPLLVVFVLLPLSTLPSVPLLFFELIQLYRL